jgi:hypothetical protein
MSKKVLFTSFIPVVLATFQLIFINSAQAQNVYHNNEGHFSFSLPKGWKEYSQNGLVALDRNASQMAGVSIRYIAAFSKPIKGGLLAINIQIFNRRKYSKDEINQWVTPRGQVIAQNMTKAFIKNIPIDFGKYAYDKDRNIVSRKNALNGDGKKIIYVEEMIFSNYGFITLTFNTTEENFDTAVDDFNQIMDSFKFDEGYNY